MIDDDLLRSLAADWKAHPDSAEVIARRFAVEQRRAAGRLALSAAGLLLVLGGLIWLAWRAWEDGDPLSMVAAAAFAVALPTIAAGVVGLSNNRGREYHQDAKNLLICLGEELVTRRRLLRSARIAAAILIAASAGGGLLVTLGYVTTQRALIPTMAWLASAALIWVWQSRLYRQLEDEETKRRDLVVEISEAG